MKNNKYPRYAALITWIFLLGLLCFAAADAQETKDKESDFILRMQGILDRQRILTLPETLNGIPVKKLKEYEQINHALLLAHRKRGTFTGTLLMYRDIDSKYLDLKAYNRDLYQETPLKDLFTKGFTPVSEDGLLKNSPYSIPESERKGAKDTIQDLLAKSDIAAFEKKASETGVLRPDKALSFYDSLRKKLETDLQLISQEFIDETERAKKETDLFARRNIHVAFQIGSNPGASGVKKNFKENQPIVAGIVCSSGGVTGEIPVEWVLKSPDGREKKGKTTILGNQQAQLCRLYETVVQKETAGGQYEMLVTVFPGTTEEAEYREYFTVGSVPFTISRAFILSEDRQPRDAYMPEDTILLAVQYHPVDTKIETATFTWLVTDTAGKKISSLCVSKALKLRSNDKPLQTKYIKAVIPKKFPGGTYVYRMNITAGKHRESSDPVSFTVLGDTVKPEPDDTK